MGSKIFPGVMTPHGSWSKIFFEVMTPPGSGLEKTDGVTPHAPGPKKRGRDRGFGGFDPASPFFVKKPGSKWKTRVNRAIVKLKSKVETGLSRKQKQGFMGSEFN